MAKRRSDPAEIPTTPLPIPDFDRGAEGKVFCGKMTVRRLKGGEIVRDLEFERDVTDATVWPPHMASQRAEVEAAIAGTGPTYSAKYGPLKDGKATLHLFVNSAPVEVADCPATLRSVKLDAKKGGGTIRWVVRYHPKGVNVAGFDDAIGSDASVSFAPAQQKLPLGDAKKLSVVGSLPDEEDDE